MKIVPPEENNVTIMEGVTRLSIPVERVLNAALDTQLTSVVILGEYEDGTEYFASSDASGPETLWKLQKAKYKLMKITEDPIDV